MGLGAVSVVSLAEARDTALDLRRQIHRGTDPLEARRLGVEQARREVANAQTFKDCAEAYVAAHKAGWRNEKHGAQWEATLATYAYPVIGTSPVQDIGTAAVMRVLDPIWSVKPETAKRLRGRIESVLDWAAVREFRRGENPARWRGHLDKLLPAPSKVRQVEHHPALPFAEIADFMTSLRGQRGVAASALEFAIFTAARTSETIEAEWREIDFEKKLWTIPGERMKAGKQHRVPLSDAAIAVLRQMEKIRESGFVFPGAKRNRPLSNMSLLQLLKRMGRSDITVHGFRATFRSWCSECTDFPSELAEMALAHAIRDKVEAAYRRGDLLERRYELMAQWAAYCACRVKRARWTIPP